jgi:sporulation protein YlmC with PRC-barrel domain
MKNVSLFLSVLLLTAMILTACGEAETNTPGPETEVSPFTEEPTLTDEPLSTETAMAVDETTTPVIPVTGAEDPSRLSNQLTYDVWNQDGEQIGEVNDIILDLDNSRVSYVIVGTGGFLEIGEKDVLVPWNSLQIQTAAEGGPAGDQNAFILQIDQETFNNAPDIDVYAILPDFGMPPHDWDLDIRNYWESGILPATAAPDDGTVVPEMTATLSPDATEIVGSIELQGVVLATDVIGSQMTLSPGVGETGEISDPATATPDTTVDATATVDPAVATAGPGVGNFNGTVDDVIVDVDTGNILYFVVDAPFDDAERWIPIPMNLFQWDVNNDIFTLNVNPATLRDAPFFEEGLYPDMSVDGWDSEFHSFWQ